MRVRKYIGQRWESERGMKGKRGSRIHLNVYKCKNIFQNNQAAKIDSTGACKEIGSM